MKILKKIGSFFAASVPFIVYTAVQFVIVFWGIMLVIAVKMISTPELYDTISHKEDMVLTIILSFACLFAFLIEMKIHKFKFSDISPVKQNKAVYILAAVFAFGVFFVFRLVSSLFTPEGTPGLADEVTKGTEILTFIAFISVPLAEELFFRGMLVKTFEKRFSMCFSAASATVFSILGMLIGSSLNICFGILLELAVIFIRYKFGDLKLCILANVIMTAMYVVFSLTVTEAQSAIMIAGAIIGAVISAAAMFFMLKKSSKPEITAQEG